MTAVPNRRRRVRLIAVAIGFAGVMATSAACSSGAASLGGASSAASGPSKVALLLPETDTPRYEAHDRPLFTAELKKVCPVCQLLYSSAQSDSSKQQQQAEAAITNGAKVLVLDPVDRQSAVSIVAMADQADVKVIDYERLIPAKVDWYVSYDNLSVGKLQATALVKQMKAIGKPNGTIVMIDGAPTDGNAVLFKQGAHSVLDTSGLKIGAEDDTPDWSASEAQQEMQQAITKLGAGSIDGVYAANDGTAGGAYAAMTQAGMKPIPPLTGQDADVAGVQRILAEEQFMTIYKAIAPEAKLSADVAAALASGQSIPSTAVNKHVTDGLFSIPSTIYTPTVVTAANAKATVFADGFVTYAQVCTAQFAAACSKAGITS
jgi:D-xylose transport system substrate-binding protein